MLLLLGLAGCLGAAALKIPEGDTSVADTGTPTGFTDGPIEQPLDTGTSGSTVDTYEGAFLRVVSPTAGSVWPLVGPVELRAELVGADGVVLEPTPIQWTTDRDVAWVGEGASVDATLDAGPHRLTARTRLPDGTGLAHSVGEVRVQSPFTGTYAGLFQVDLDALGLTFSCTGSAAVSVGPWGREGIGTGSCLLSVLVLDLDLPLTYVFDLDIDTDGTVTGDAGVEILLITYNFPAEGTLAPDGDGFDVVFAGDVPLLGPIDASVAAPRVSLDP